MSAISAEEMKARRDSVASNFGTHAMEGLFPDAPTLNILRRYETGELTLDQFSEAMDAHAQGLIAARHTLVGVV
jgi:hypothetical protein